VWDEKAALLGEGKPVKVDDHSLDAGRYAIKTPEVLWRPLVREPSVSQHDEGSHQAAEISY
jgi:hypothetical protein